MFLHLPAVRCRYMSHFEQSSASAGGGGSVRIGLASGSPDGGRSSWLGLYSPTCGWRVWFFLFCFFYFFIVGWRPVTGRVFFSSFTAYPRARFVFAGSVPGKYDGLGTTSRKAVFLPYDSFSVFTWSVRGARHGSDQATLSFRLVRGICSSSSTACFVFAMAVVDTTVPLAV